MPAPSTLDPQAAHESRLVALSPDLLGAAAFDGTVRLANPAWSAALGLDASELESRAWIDLIHPDDREEARAAVQRMARGERVEGLVCRLTGADGTERCYLWSGRGSPQDGCFYIAGKDITERRRLESELESRARRLEAINAELQEFAYVASHDLAEPLRMVTSYLELLERRYGERLDDTAREFIGFAVGGARRMRALIDDLLAISRVGSGQLERREVDLGALLDAVLRDLSRAIAEARATVEVPGDPPVVHADPTQLGQLLQNLIANAVKFRAPDRAPRVVVSATPRDGGVVLEVADNGIGIAPDQQERIFTMFTRLHPRDEYDGTGIGLALCRRIAQRHGGRIWVRSAPGEGSAFCVWLPGGERG